MLEGDGDVVEQIVELVPHLHGKERGGSGGVKPDDSEVETNAVAVNTDEIVASAADISTDAPADTPSENEVNGSETPSEIKPADEMETHGKGNGYNQGNSQGAAAGKPETNGAGAGGQGNGHGEEGETEEFIATVAYISIDVSEDVPSDDSPVSVENTGSNDSDPGVEEGTGEFFSPVADISIDVSTGALIIDEVSTADTPSASEPTEGPPTSEHASPCVTSNVTSFSTVNSCDPVE